MPVDYQAAGKLYQGKVVLRQPLIAHEYLAELVQPCVTPLYYPSPCWITIRIPLGRYVRCVQPPRSPRFKNSVVPMCDGSYHEAKCGIVYQTREVDGKTKISNARYLGTLERTEAFGDQVYSLAFDQGAESMVHLRSYLLSDRSADISHFARAA